MTEPPKAAAAPSWRTLKGGRARRDGRGAEWLAAAFLMLRGYQILGFRLMSRAGEIDILARRGKVLAVIEVKRRTTIDAALKALGEPQKARLMAAGRAIARSRPSLNGLELRFDLLALAPGRLPRHIRGLTPPSSRP